MHAALDDAEQAAGWPVAHAAALSDAVNAVS